MWTRSPAVERTGPARNKSEAAGLAGSCPGSGQSAQQERHSAWIQQRNQGRYQTAAELRADLKRLTRDLTLDAQGNVVADEQQTTLQDIPAVARAAIEKAATGGKLTLVEKVIEGSSILYEGHITKGGKELEIKVDANGKPVE